MGDHDLNLDLRDIAMKVWGLLFVLIAASAIAVLSWIFFVLPCMTGCSPVQNTQRYLYGLGGLAIALLVAFFGIRAVATGKAGGNSPAPGPPDRVAGGSAKTPPTPWGGQRRHRA